MKPMISSAKLYDLTGKQVKTYDYSSKIICNVPNVSFYQGDCEMCPGTENLIKNTEQRSEDNNIGNITYIQWMTTDRSTLKTTM
jgi:hypothetical protein